MSAALLTMPAWAADLTGPASGYTPGAIDKSLAGTTINLLVPPWGAYKQAKLDDFTARTGITVKVQTVDFDSIHDKIVTAAASGQPVADIIELDWTWVSQFGAAGWLTPLDKYLAPQQVQDAAGLNSFTYQGQLVGLPYSLDFRGTLYNMTKFGKAGINQPPATWSELLDDAKKIKTSGAVQYPIGLPLSISENTSTPWYALVRAAGGEVLDEKGEPVFATNGAGAGALQFIHDAYAAGLIDPGSIGLTVDQVHQEFTGGNSAVMLAAWPSSVNDSKSGVANSNIVGDNLLFAHEPGEKDDKGGTIALAEALAIPSGSKNKEAAAMYLSWMFEPQQQLAAYQDADMGLLPTNTNALKTLAGDQANNAMMGASASNPAHHRACISRRPADLVHQVQRGSCRLDPGRCARPRHCSSGSR